METIVRCQQLSKNMLGQARAQSDALVIIEKTFAEEADRLHRVDQAHKVDVLRARIAGAVAAARDRESVARSAHVKANLITGSAKFALGALIAAVRRTEEHPLSVGARLAKDDFSHDEPFGTVMVSIGPGGVPDDVQVISVSECARDSRMPERDVTARAASRGLRMMTPEAFSRYINELKGNVLQGALSLPVITPRPVPRLVRRSASVSPRILPKEGNSTDCSE